MGNANGNVRFAQGQRSAPDSSWRNEKLRSFAQKTRSGWQLFLPASRSVWLNAFRPYKRKLCFRTPKLFFAFVFGGGGFHAGFVPLVSGVLFRGRGFLFGGGLDVLFGFGRLFLFFFLLGGFLYPRKLAQDFHALLRSFRAAIQLNGKNILYDLVELRTPRHAEGFKFGGHNRQGLADRAPFVKERLQLGQCGGVAGLREKIRHIFHRNLFDVAISVDGRLSFLSGEFFLDVEGLLRKFLNGLNFSGAVAKLRKRVAQLPIFQPAENGQQHRSGKKSAESCYEKNDAHFDEAIDRLVAWMLFVHTRWH